MEPNHRPTREEIQAAIGKTVPDVIAPGLKVLFVGINPGLYTAAVGHHFARPGNRFWPALYMAGITPRLLAPHEECLLLDYGYGITNLVARASAGENDLAAEELVEGGRALSQKVARYHPGILALLGIGAFRRAFKQPKAVIGPQAGSLAGAALWVLPNPSGLNAHYQLEDLARMFRELHRALG